MSDKPVILITGASSGIGAATARLFAQKGYSVILTARRTERLKALAQEIQFAGGQALPVTADMWSLEDIDNLVYTALDTYGQIDVLFNNAGFGRLDWLDNLQPKSDIEAQIDVNLLGVIQLTRAVLPHMIARRQGNIINMASVAGFVATPTYCVYAASKFAVRGFSEALRREVGIHNIKVSLICPGQVATEFGEIAGFHRTTRVTMPGFLTLSAEGVAHAVFRLARHPRRVMVIPWLLNLGIWSNALLPGVLDWAMAHLFVIPVRKID